MAGQVGSDVDGKLVEGGLAAQAERALLNVGLLLDAAGAELVKLTLYVVDYRPEKFQELGAGLMAEREFPQVPVTLLGVQALFAPEQLVEIVGEAVA
jgi:enamine deaminase RidA (YjgF/YER057c/UK114 family)